MNTAGGSISLEEKEFPKINRKITLSELNESIKRAFPIIYGSMHRGRGLALGIVKYLYEHGEASMYALKRALNAELPAVRKILMRMEKKGYVKHVKVKGRGPQGTYIYSLTKLGELVYHTVFTRDPHSWLIKFILEEARGGKKKLKSEFIEFLERNKRLLENEAFTELSNYLFIKCMELNLEEQYEYLGRDPLQLTISVSYGLLLSIVLSFARISKFSTSGDSVQEAIELLKLYPAIGKGECLEYIPFLLDELLKQNTLSELELYKILTSYLKDVVLPMTLASLNSIVNLVIALEPIVKPQFARKIKELDGRIRPALNTLEKAVEELEKIP